MQKWEYLAVQERTIALTPSESGEPLVIGILNIFGGQGWEVVSVTNLNQDELLYLLKRPIE